MVARSDVKVVITADAKQMTRTIDRLQAQNKRLRESNKRLGGSFKNLAASLSPVRLGLAGVVTGAIALGNSMRHSIDEIGKMSTSMGVSVETLQKWEHTAKLTGTTLQTFTKGQRILAGAIFDANRGLKSYQDAFTAVGLSWTDLQRMSPEEQMNAVADALAQVEDKSVRTAVAQDLLGRAGTQLLVAFGENEGTLAKTNSELAKSAILTDSQVKAVEAFNDGLTNLSAKIRGVFIQSFITLQKHLSQIGEYLREKVFPPLQKVSDFVRDNLKPILTGLVGALSAVAVVMTTKVVVSLVLATKKMIALGIATTVATGGLNLIVPALVAVSTAIGVAYSKSETFKNIVDSVGRFLRDTIWPILKTTASIIGDVFVAQWNHLTSVLRNGIDFIKNVFAGDWRGAWEAIKTFFSEAIKNITGTWGKIWPKIKEATLLGGIGILTAVEVIAEKVTGAFSSMWNTVVNLFTANLRTVSNLLGKIPGMGGVADKINAGLDAVKRTLTFDPVKLDLAGGLEKQLAAHRASLRKVGDDFGDLSTGAVLRSVNMGFARGRELMMKRVIEAGRGTTPWSESGRPLDTTTDKDTTTTTDSDDTTGGSIDKPEDPNIEADRMAALQYERGVLSPEAYIDYLTRRMSESGGSWTRKGSRFYDLIQNVHDDMARALKERSNEQDRLRKEQEEAEEKARKEREKKQMSERRERERLEDLRFEFGETSPEEYLGILRQRREAVGGQWTEEGARIHREITRLVESMKRKEKDEVYVSVKSDDKPERRIRAQRGPVQARPRGAC